MGRVRNKDNFVARADRAIRIALAASKASLKAVRRMGDVRATTPGIRFKKDGTAVITVNLELKIRDDEHESAQKGVRP